MADKIDADVIEEQFMKITAVNIAYGALVMIPAGVLLTVHFRRRTRI